MSLEIERKNFLLKRQRNIKNITLFEFILWYAIKVTINGKSVNNII